MRNILFLADPNSLHDIKWISFFAHKGKGCFLLPRVYHYEQFNRSLEKDSVLEQYRFQLLPPIHDFSILRFYRTLYEAHIIRRIIVEKRIDVVHILYAEPNALWCLFRRFFSVPMIITTRGTDVLKTIPTFFKRRGLLNWTVAKAFKRAFRLADWVTVTSRAQAESIKEFAGVEGGLEVIRTGVDVDLITADTSGYFPLQESKPFVLFPRFLKPVYNHEFSLAAIALLPPEIKNKYKMVFIGKNGSDTTYRKKLEDLMLRQPDVQFELIESQSQVAIFELYKRASLVVMTPLSDGSPVSGMEALLCGAKLILGPLNYDMDIFSQAIRLSQWDPDVLAKIVTDALAQGHKSPRLTEAEIQAMDRAYNMQKMSEIYEAAGRRATRSKQTSP
ncbi:MAG TPA: glycosyltransferase family 4 protein [Cyclobacteriaceae bacterium]